MTLACVKLITLAITLGQSLTTEGGSLTICPCFLSSFVGSRVSLSRPGWPLFCRPLVSAFRAGGIILMSSRDHLIIFSIFYYFFWEFHTVYSAHILPRSITSIFASPLPQLPPLPPPLLLLSLLLLLHPPYLVCAVHLLKCDGPSTGIC
jgi:hypothetical protein